ncbi:MAG: hypothetical protein A2792_00245 [Sphingomonadales bacterium RIFCSPHIGHO2_01_FULL_65_20]|nr:MAG: hypothetical protein A2792_00245 [Sphingomonadales bacterium RIFCSPHIGHO2_01_FULL_65_20]
MSDLPHTPAQHLDSLLTAAGQSAAVTFDLLEHHRDMTRSDRLDRFSNETCEMLADALQSTLRIEICAIQNALASAPTEHAERSLREQSELNNQLLGAVARYLEGWA